MAASLSVHPRSLSGLPEDVLGTLQEALRADEKLRRSQGLIHRMRVRMAELQGQATTDSLTGLASRRGMEIRLAQECANARRSGLPFTIFLVDADNLKTVNDTMGHAAGDHLLRELADRLNAAVREVDMAARLGGDEFVLICPGMDEAAAGELSRRLSTRISGQAVLPRTILSVSIGWVVASADAQPGHLLAAADRAMYEAKAGVVAFGRVGSVPGRRVIERTLAEPAEADDEQAAG